ncbi:hypothetical protein niasHT_008365 [Heterodera trifolii]|uniref:MULE transposase domain-containing protein n=1 Tax=Heterodera trifolii TaxID=157864 RepID=A0ABD2M6R2_9BILA
MIRNKLESLQKSRKKRYLTDISNTTEEAVNFGVEIDEPQAMITSDNVEQQTLNEAELSTDFDSHTTQEIAGDAQIAVAQHMQRSQTTAKPTLEILRQCGTWHLDGTFKCAPSMWEQCFVIGASVHHRMCICMWCLLPGKQRRYYEEALNFLCGRTSPVVPGKVFCDFEKAEMAAIRAVFPTAQIKCCMFYYGQSLYRNFKRLGLVHLYGEKTEYGEAVRNTFRVLSLPLLPPDIIRRAFSIIVASSPPGMPVFFLYFSRTYIGLTQRQLLDGVNAFGDNRLNFSPIGNHSSLGTTISTINSEHSYAATPVQFGIGSPAPSTLTWPTTVSPLEQIVQYSLSPLSTSTAPSAWEDEIVRAPHFSIPMWNMHSATSALARTNNGLEATHLHFMKGLCHHPALSDFICGVNESIDRQVDAARSARHFIHKRHKRYILQDAVIMRILADASYNNNGDIHDLMTALGLQVEGYAGKLKDFENFDDSIVHVPPLDISWFFTLLDISWLGQFVAWTFRGLDNSWLGHFVAWTFLAYPSSSFATAADPEASASFPPSFTDLTPIRSKSVKFEAKRRKVETELLSFPST